MERPRTLFLQLSQTSVFRTLKKHVWSLFFLSCTFGAYFVFIFSQMLFYKDDNLWAGHVHVWGDWSLHISMANIFAYKQPSEWFTYHPYYAGGKLTYGFLTNMISGLLVRAGWDHPAAFLIPSIIYSLFLVFGLYVLYYQILRTQKAALTSVVIFFCSSGLGFLRFTADWLLHPTLENFLNPTKDYTRIEPVYQWLAGNWVNGMLVPQRAYLLGITIAVWVLNAVLYVLYREKFKDKLTVWQKIILVAAGIGAGILPITHMHSFIVLVIVSAFFGLSLFPHWKVQWPRLFWYGVPAGLLSTVLYWIFVKGGIENPDFMKILVGWTAPMGTNQLEHLLNWLKMWWEIWGVMMPIAIIGAVIAWKKLRLPSFAVLISGFAVFALGNIILFQPIHWDNSKLFMWAYVFLAGFATLVLQQLWRKEQWQKIIAVFLFLLLTTTGVMELWRLTRFDKNSHIMATHEDIETGELIRHYTNSQSIFLIAPTHNHPAMMWGVRPVLLGYTAWAWNFGFLYREREADISRMYQGGPEAEKLLKKYKVSYVAVGPTELNNLFANEIYFSSKFPLYLKSGAIRFYDVRSVTGGP